MWRNESAVKLRVTILACSLMLPFATSAAGQDVGPAANVHAGTPATQSEPRPAEDAEPFPISVAVVPDMVLVVQDESSQSGRKVMIKGETLPAGTRPVKIVIEAEDFEPQAFDAPVDDAGRFSFDEFVPIEVGEYEITVTAPDGRGEATTILTAIEVPDLGEALAEGLGEAARSADAAISVGADKLDELPASPAKDAAEAKVTEAKTVAARLANAGTPDSIKGVFGAVHTDSALREALSPLIEPRLDELTLSTRQLQTETERVRELASQVTSADIGCHQLVFVSELFKAIGAVLSVKLKALEAAIGLATDVVSDVAANKAKQIGAGDAHAFAVSQVIKNANDLDSASSLANNAKSILVDLAGLISDSAFAAYCEQFVGPIQATMEARFFLPDVPDSPLWWKYDFQVTGRLILYYPKSAKGKGSIPLKGRIEGYAHSFSTWEDALKVTFPKRMAGAMEYKRHFPPVEIGAVPADIMTRGQDLHSPYLQGSVADALLPNGFIIDVEGVLEEDSLSVLIGEALVDFDASHRVTALILSPLTGAFGPQITWYELPFRNAHHVFDMASKGEPFRLELVKSDEKMTAEGEFTATGGGARAKGQYTLKLKVCNPGC
jgi:hypothetical protein